MAAATAGRSGPRGAGLVAGHDGPFRSSRDPTIRHVGRRATVGCGRRNAADAARLSRSGRAYGTLRGQANRRIPLTLVRIEPQVVEKRALSGGSERVDTRVVEAIYSFDPAQAPAYLGQRMDVFVEAAPSPTQAAAPTMEPAR